MFEKKASPRTHARRTDDEVTINGLSNKIAELEMHECLNIEVTRVDSFDKPIDKAYFQCPKHIIVDHMKKYDTDTLYFSAWTGEKGRASSLQNTQLKTSGKWAKYISRTFVAGKADGSINLLSLMVDSSKQMSSREKTKADQIRGSVYESLDIE